MPSLIILALLLFALESNGQNPYCDGDRYLNEVFPNVTVTTVKYGENTTYSGNLENLQMDVYTPDGDVATARPVVILAFGGSFIFGNRSTMASYCNYYATRGYVAVSIDYRLYDGPLFPLPDSSIMLDVVVKAIGDIKASVRYFRKDAATTNQFKADTNFIFIGGQSAGAILAGHTAYINDISEVTDSFIIDRIVANGGLEGTTDDPANPTMGYSSEVHGFINQFGGLYRPAWIQAGDVPMVSIHGTNDDVVPYGSGYVTISGFPIIRMNGSGIMHPQANQEGVFNHLITVPGGGHGDFLSNPVWRDSLDNMSSWMMEAVSCGNLSSTEQIDISHQVSIYPNPASDLLNIELSDVRSSYDIKVFDGLGRLVKVKDGVARDFQLDITTLNEGFYHIYILFDDQTLAPISEKVLISK